MPANVYVMEAANLIVGDYGTEPAPGYSTHLTLAELKLPGMEENYVDFLPGGAPVAIEVPTHFNRLESSFNLNGWQPEIMGCLAQSDVRLLRFTAYGLIRNRLNNDACQAVAVMWGKLGRVNPTAFRRGDLMVHEFAIRSITHYELLMQPARGYDLKEIYKWDFFSNEFWDTTGDIRTNVNEDLIRILALPTSSG